MLVGVQKDKASVGNQMVQEKPRSKIVVKDLRRFLLKAKTP